MSTQDAATIAASVVVTTTEGRNLRACLLRRLDQEFAYDYDTDPGDAEEACDAAYAMAYDLGLVSAMEQTDLTPLGREVAELLRPEPWRVLSETDDGWTEWVVAKTEWDAEYATCSEPGARRIADLLTKADADEAKRYRTG
jgi:hypothetical protein